MQGARRCLLAVAVATVSSGIACRGGDTNVRVSSTGRDHSDATFTSRDTARKLGPGDVQIVNSDSTLELGLYGDSIVTGLGSKVLNEIREKTDTAAVTGTGLSATIEKFVKGTVADAMSHEIKYAVADVKDVRYEDGRLEFFWKDGSRMKLFENTTRDKKPMSQTFRSEDAQRFVAAFKARKASGG